MALVVHNICIKKSQFLLLVKVECTESNIQNIKKKFSHNVDASHSFTGALTVALSRIMQCFSTK